MADLNDIITLAITVDSTISINPLSKVEIEMLSNLVVWDKKTPGNKPMYFGGSYFKQADTDKNAIIIDTGLAEFDFELKAIMISALHFGTVEGGTPYKWRSVAERIKNILCVSSIQKIHKLPRFKQHTRT